MINTFTKKISLALLAGLFALIPASFALAGTAPTMTNTVATGVTSSVATLNGTFASNGSVTKIRFEYGDTPLMLSTTTYQTKTATDSGTFSAQINVLPGKTYFYQAMGINANGPAWATPPQTFTTPSAPSQTLPTVMTNLQTGVTTTSATLNGFFNGNGSLTTTHFEYGTTTALGTSTPSISQSNNFGNFTATITVVPGTTYYFKAVATNSAGTKQGSVLNFQTPGIPATYQCNDGVDNDGNGLTDFPADPGCSSATDATEYTSGGSSTQCNDGVDNDGDGLTDYPADSGCVSLADNTEYNSGGNTFQCNDGIDNDSNGLTDYPQDPGCSSLSDSIESGYSNPNNTNVPTTITYGASNIGNTAATLNGYVDPQGSYTTYWFVYGTNPNMLYSNTTTSIQWFSSGNVSYGLSGLQANTTYYYKLIAQNSYGSNTTASIQSFTTNGGTNPGGSAPKAMTTVETSVTSTGATLHGIVMNASVPTTVWFEYGTTNAFGNTTSVQSVGPGSQLDFSRKVSGLASNTIYYWRAVAQNQYGISYGGTLVFETKSKSTGGGSGGGGAVSASYVSFKIENTYKNISVGDTVHLIATYKNTSKKTFKDAVIKIALPHEISYQRSSRGSYSKAGNSITVSIDTLVPGQEGSISIEGKAKGGNDNIVTTGVMSYTDISTGAQYEAVAYSISNISGSSDGNLLAGASIFGDGGFLPDSLIEWLILILVIFGLIYFGRKMYAK